MARFLLPLSLVVAALAAAPARAQDLLPTPAQAQFFESQIRPLLSNNCHKCHGPDKQRGRLRLDSRAGILAGGVTGPAVVPGKPRESLLIRAVHYQDLEMPPGKKLARKDVALLEQWVAMGAPWPGVETTIQAGGPRQEGLQVTDHD